jgi:dTDP-4-dehydrorhamnose reductase
LSNEQSSLELWGGVECTINRVGDAFHDQWAWTRHRDQVESDLALFADLGLRTLRTAVHWEQVAHTENWDFADRNLGTIKSLKLQPIVGLLHHGSGPRHTNLLDPEFAPKFASFALQVARRFPWVTDYTPINEPQTTSRFSCLYRHWYPHHRCICSYVRALLNQVKGIALAMEAIRSVQPKANLIHTEDGGKTFSTARLKSFRTEREQRRWLGLDLLCGRVVRSHPQFHFLLSCGVTEQEILWFSEHPCPPSLIGLNYYVTSDRFLDHRTELYPDIWKGGDSGSEPLVDVEAVRIFPNGIAGAKSILQDAWLRYELPVAITEAHLGCLPDEQVRWLSEVWRGAEDALAAGVDVRAVTAWGLLGLYNWSNLCTQDSDSYEPGVFNISNGSRKMTSLGTAVRQLATGRPLQHESLNSLGWWNKDSRFTLPLICAREIDPNTHLGHCRVHADERKGARVRNGRSR